MTDIYGEDNFICLKRFFCKIMCYSGYLLKLETKF